MPKSMLWVFRRSIHYDVKLWSPYPLRNHLLLVCWLNFSREESWLLRIKSARVKRRLCGRERIGVRWLPLPSDTTPHASSLLMSVCWVQSKEGSHSTERCCLWTLRWRSQGIMCTSGGEWILRSGRCTRFTGNPGARKWGRCPWK